MIPILATVFGALAALLHVYIFVMESVQWSQPRIWRRFGVADQAAADTTKPMAYNQGFYNLFLAIGAIIGLALFWAGATDLPAAVAGSDPRAVHPGIDGRRCPRPAHDGIEVPAPGAHPGHAAADRLRAVPLRLTQAASPLSTGVHDVGAPAYCGGGCCSSAARGSEPACTSKETTMADFTARAETDISAPPDRVWQLLTQPGSDPDIMFGSEVVSDWQVGSPITWKGEWEGKPFEDKGEIVAIDPPARLEVTHFSPMSGDADVPENYHRLAYELEATDAGTHVTLTQGGNASEEAAEHSTANWQMMLDGLKKAAERN